MKKIVFLTGSMARGGAERVISILSEKYVNLGWDVSIMMLLHSFVEYDLPKEVKIIDISNDKRRSLFDIPRLKKEIKKYALKEKPDVMVAFMAQISLIAGMALKKTDIRLITSERNDPEKSGRNIIFKKQLDKIFTSSYKTVMQTERVKNYFPDSVQKNSIIIPNPIRVMCEAKDDRRKRIVTVGRLSSQKNQKMLIDAFSNIHKKYPDYILDIYGKGKLEGELNEKIKELGLENNVFLKGSSSKIHEDIADAEIFALPSDYEGLSNALLEAMMMGLACVSTNCAGSDEAITDGENGLLVEVGNAKQMEKALERLISDEELRIRLGENAKESAKYYYVDNVIDMWRDVIEG